MTEYSTKAKIYHKYRWDYSIEAIQYIHSSAQISQESVIADMGAGTGILTKHFIDIAGKVYAVEPDENMLSILKHNFSCVIPVHRFAHDIPEIDNKSVDVIIAAQSLHWFDFGKTILEFNRIAKENCLLFSIWNTDITSGNFSKETVTLMNKYKNSEIENRQVFNNLTNYYKEDSIINTSFDSDGELDFETYIGSITSASFMPSEDDESFSALRNDAFYIFQKYKSAGKVQTKIRTNLLYGRLAKV